MEDTIKKDNKKALPKFLIIIFTAGLVGGILGSLASMASDGAVIQAIPRIFKEFLKSTALYVIPVIGIPVILLQIFVEKKARVMMDSWDGEDDEIPEQIDHKLDLLLMIHGLAWGISYLAFSAGAVLLDKGVQMAFMLMEFFIIMAALMYMQKRTIDFSRRMNPEKQGSVFDMKFCEKWNSSCDEAEKKLMGEAGLRTFMIMNRLLVILWAVLFILNILLPVGLLPFFLVIGIWITMQMIYHIVVMKLSRRR